MGLREGVANSFDPPPVADHVAVLRARRDFLREASGRSAPSTREGDRAWLASAQAEASALDHAIALDAEARKLAETAMEAAKKLDNMREQHAALVARLGELERFLRSRYEGDQSEAGDLARIVADDLARVLSEGEGK